MITYLLHLLVSSLGQVSSKDVLPVGEEVSSGRLMTPQQPRGLSGPLNQSQIQISEQFPSANGNQVFVKPRQGEGVKVRERNVWTVMLFDCMGGD